MNENKIEAMIVKIETIGIRIDICFMKNDHIHSHCLFVCLQQNTNIHVQFYIIRPALFNIVTINSICR